MSVRLLQVAFAAGNCLFGVVMLSLYGPALVQTRAWPLDLRQEVLVLVAGSILPLAILAFRFPLIAGIAQFSTAFIGNQLLHEAPLARLRDLSTVSMGLALAMLFIAVFRGILEITQEAFGESEEAEEEDSVRAA
ncbi:MAG TPA: hypothetical protein VL990_14165 [Acidobacteriaceae bacterium]|nr:hypothetical protein [Acidobacteriaceae bacterium]